jgi:hypothetical protein
MAVDTSGIKQIGASTQQAAPAPSGLQNLQLAFEQGLVSGNEIGELLFVKPQQQKVRREKALAELELLPLQERLAKQQLEVATDPRQQQLAELNLQGQLSQAEGALALQPTKLKLEEFKTNEDLRAIEDVLGAQPFATPDNARIFFERTHPGEKVPEDSKKLAQRNLETFTALRSFKQSLRGTGEPTTETFVELDPETFDKRRVRVSFDGAGNEISRKIIGITETGEKALTEQQANAVQFSARMNQATANIEAIEAAGFDPSTYSNYAQQWASRHKLGVLSSSQAQQYEAAKRNWMAAVLRKESGAAIAESEYRGADHQYFPQPRDTPEAMEQKSQLRQTATGTMIAAGSFGLSPAQQEQLSEQFDTKVAPQQKITTNHAVLPDDQVPGFDPKVLEETLAGNIAPAAAKTAPAAARTPAARATDAPLTIEGPVVNSPAEAASLAPNVQFFKNPQGRILRNPNFRP